MGDKIGYKYIDEPRERFLGWWPYMKKQGWVVVATLFVILYDCGISMFLPKFWLFGLIPSIWVWGPFLGLILLQVVSDVYFNKYWTAWDDDDIEE